MGEALISSKQVTEVFYDCLFKEEELAKGNPAEGEFVPAQGLTISAGFHPGRLQEHAEEILAIIDNLPEEFKQGWSFLNFCTDREGNQWTGMHKVCEQLVMLGIAIDKLEYCMPRDMWGMLPGGVPYIQVK